MAVLAGKGDSLEAVVDQVLATRDRVVVEREGVPAAVVLSARELEGLEYSIDLLSEPKLVRRILEGEAALQSGNLYMGEELGRARPRRALHRALGDRRPDRWRRRRGRPVIAAGGLSPACRQRKALDELQFHVADAARSFIFGQLLADPSGSGVELHGFLARRLAARVETALVIYRLDSVKHLVRLVEVLHLGGLRGSPGEPPLVGRPGPSQRGRPLVSAARGRRRSCRWGERPAPAETRGTAAG